MRSTPVPPSSPAHGSRGPAVARGAGRTAFASASTAHDTASVAAVSPDAAQTADGADEVEAPGGTKTFKDVLKAYVALTKPRIIELLLVVTVPAMFLAANGFPHPVLRLVSATMIGGFLAAGSANAFNCVLDRDIDEVMRRTRRRPMPRHRVTPAAGYTFAIVLGVLATLILGFGANWLSAMLALAANAFYVLVYTMWLKRRTSQNIVWGGIAGCFPPLIGWTAVTNHVSWAPIILFLIVFFWTPPHTWSLAFRYREDYAAANVPMLPVVMDAVGVAWRILAYSVLTVATAMLVWPVAHTGWLYPLVTAVGGVVFLREAWQLLARARAGLRDAQLRPMRLFHWSNSYLALIFLAAAIDPFVR